jgi:hypothetical protein
LLELFGRRAPIPNTVVSAPIAVPVTVSSAPPAAPAQNQAELVQ